MPNVSLLRDDMVSGPMFAGGGRVGGSGGGMSLPGGSGGGMGANPIISQVLQALMLRQAIEKAQAAKAGGGGSGGGGGGLFSGLKGAGGGGAGGAAGLNAGLAI